MARRRGSTPTLPTQCQRRQLRWDTLVATGARLMTTLLNELERTGGRYELQTMCEGGGRANVTIVESSLETGLMIGYSGAHLDLPVDLVQEAESLGYDSVWMAEAWGNDACTPLGYLAAVTERIRLGTAIMQVPARTPANAAMTAMTLDELSNGRFIMGIGMSGPQVVEGWHGKPYRLTLTQLREYEILRRFSHERSRSI